MWRRRTEKFKGLNTTGCHLGCQPDRNGSMNENAIEKIMKKVFKREYSNLDKYKAVIEEKGEYPK